MKLIKKITRSSVMDAIDKEIKKAESTLFDLKDRIDYHKQASVNLIKSVKPKIASNS